jgi:hypothetical protein
VRENMAFQERNGRKASVNGISEADAVTRYKSLLETEYNATDVPDRGEYVLTHKRIRLSDGNQLDIIVYSSDVIYVSGSAQIEEAKFGDMATRIIQLALQAVTKLEKVRPVSLKRAQCLLDFTKTLDVDDEYQRMAMLILTDTCNEIVLREIMQALKIEGPPLEEGIPDKIKRIKAKGYLVIGEDEIKNLREERNRVVHHGEIPVKDQALQALKVAEKVIRSVGTA